MVAFKLPGQSAKGDQPKMFMLQKFGSLNTQAQRPGIGDQEFSWIENWQVIGDANMRCLYGKGTTLYTAPGGKTIIYFFQFNIGGISYCAVFLSDGTADQVRLSNGTIVHISTNANTFYNGGDIPSCAQWGTSGILIVSTAQTNGYWAWDEAAGGTLYAPNSAAPAWLSGLVTPITTTGNTNTTIHLTSMTSSAGVVVGMTATSSASDIPANDTVVTIVSSTAVDLKSAATASNVGVTLTFNWDMPTGLNGTSVEIYQSRVWICNANNATVSFSAPSNGTGFSATLGGGTFSSTDSFLRQGYHTLKQANGFLYVFGDSSINVISNVQTSGSPATTTFNNQNTDPQMGTPWPNSVQPFGRALIFANPSGVYALYGGAAEKVSPQLDGIFASAVLPVTPPVATNYPSGAVMTINGVKCYMLNIDLLDPFTKSNRNAMVIWDGKKWFIGSQETVPIFIGTQEVNSILSAWGTDGSILFPMYAKASAALTKKFQGKLWAGDSTIFYKNAMRLYTEVNDNAGTGESLTVNIDTDDNTVSTTVTSNNVLQFQNNSGGNLQFQNNSSGNLIFVAGGFAITGQNIDARGKLLGFTVTSTSKDLTMIMIATLYQEQAPFA